MPFVLNGHAFNETIYMVIVCVSTNFTRLGRTRRFKKIVSVESSVELI